MPAFDQETFGPLAALIRAKDESDASALANASPYGLGASLWTHSTDRINRFSRDLECGMVFVNAIPGSHPEVPFGGVKHSGFGRELGRAGLMEFVNVKTLWIQAGQT
jgi:succinate-semialdehyde dehydrogenase/glutarate-semialdehyde dehydrogenase